MRDTETEAPARLMCNVSSDFARKLKYELDEAREIIRMAKAKFCEEGSDGNIASEMFSILSGGK